MEDFRERSILSSGNGNRNCRYRGVDCKHNRYTYRYLQGLIRNINTKKATALLPSAWLLF